ncbi:MAG: tetratricopeptide repeat protein [Blastocatellia bacterium]
MKKIIFAPGLLLAFATAAFAQTEKPLPSYLDGMEAMRNSDYKAAVASFRQAIAGRPDLVRAHYYLGRTLVGQELYGEALDAFSALVKLDPDNLMAHYEIGKLHIQSKDYSAAIEEYRWLKTESEKPSVARAGQNDELLAEKPADRTLTLEFSFKLY